MLIKPPCSPYELVALVYPHNCAHSHNCSHFPATFGHSSKGWGDYHGHTPSDQRNGEKRLEEILAAFCASFAGLFSGT